MSATLIQRPTIENTAITWLFGSAVLGLLVLRLATNLGRESPTAKYFRPCTLLSPEASQWACVRDNTGKMCAKWKFFLENFDFLQTNSDIGSFRSDRPHPDEGPHAKRSWLKCQNGQGQSGSNVCVTTSCGQVDAPSALTGKRPIIWRQWKYELLHYTSNVPHYFTIVFFLTVT